MLLLSLQGAISAPQKKKTQLSFPRLLTLTHTLLPSKAQKTAPSPPHRFIPQQRSLSSGHHHGSRPKRGLAANLPERQRLRLLCHGPRAAPGWQREPRAPRRLHSRVSRRHCGRGHRAADGHGGHSGH